ncbi:MAG: double-strand break repair helicase AddA [Pseudorhodobacter sp.]
MKRDDATERQVIAAEPAASTWLSANAGSGKTRVLTDRVARLLLSGVDPGQILCLTYTKAAASEMQNRLFARLGEWAMKENMPLQQALAELGENTALSDPALARARQLFARAIETPGGLRIQTIHSFCAALLRRFPLEAGVSPLFSEMDDRSAAILRDEILDDMADHLAPEVILGLVRDYSGEDLGGLADEIAAARTEFSRFLDEKDCRALFGLRPDETEEALLADVFLGGETDLLTELARIMAGGSTNDVKLAKKIDAADIAKADLAAIVALEDILLYGKSKVEGRSHTAKGAAIATKATQPALAPLLDRIEALMLRIEAARPRRLAFQAARRAAVLHRFASVFLPEYARRKAERGWLDFDDLITHARRLLTDKTVAQWVLYRLDGGVDHILVDEAQDTSPEQWQVIELLAAEFTAGEGARGPGRTIFVVGDKKQSIYSFQGADPREFDRMRQDFAARLAGTDKPLQDMQMDYSFRSSQAILSVVDATFAGADASGFTPGQAHRAFHAQMPGRVDLWPVIAAPETEDPPDWHDPVDMPAANDPEIELAGRIADEIKAMVDAGQPIPDKRRDDGSYSFRPIRPGDVLILVQRRRLMFHELIAACKRVGLPVAGADRLKVAGELAVRDIGALLSFLATPEDSLSLACALRSPLFGWSEAELYALAQGRAQPYLWQALRARRDEFPGVMAILDDLRGQADFLRPYELIERILTRHDGRRRLLARLGPEAEDGIDALLAQAMVYEQKSVDSLTGFLVWLQTDDMEIKRQMDEAGDQVRVMTVHGAKGLESPVVILPETGVRRTVNSGQMMPVGDRVLWKPPLAEAPAALREAVGASGDAVRAERDRLLYVAMTRAETWLIVAAAGDVGQADDSWYRQVEAGMQGAGDSRQMTGGGLRVEAGDWQVTGGAAVAAPPAAASVLPGFFRAPAPAPASLPPTLSPSDLGGAKALQGEAGQDEAAALRRGRQVHLLLEILPGMPQADWPGTARRLLAGEADRASVMDEVRQVLTDPDLRALFAGEALTEVPVTAALPSLGGRRIHGVIDRLIVSEGDVLAVDFKSNAVVPADPGGTPEGLLRQMGAYAEALGPVFPGCRIRVALLWTRQARLMVLPHELVIAALKRSGLP